MDSGSAELGCCTYCRIPAYAHGYLRAASVLNGVSYSLISIIELLKQLRGMCSFLNIIGENVGPPLQNLHLASMEKSKGGLHELRQYALMPCYVPSTLSGQ